MTAKKVVPPHLVGLHPAIIAAVMAPKKKPSRTQVQGYDRRTSKFRGDSKIPPLAPVKE